MVKIDPEDWISVSEAAKLRGVARQTIYDLIERGKLKTQDIFGRTMLKRSEVLAYDPDADKGGRPRKKDSPVKNKK